MTESRSAVIALTEAEFDTFCQSSTKPVLADFWAPWCSPCRFLAPLFEKFAREFADKAVFVKINRDEALDLRARFEIHTIPRLILFQDGKPVSVEVGLSPYNTQHARVKKMLGLKSAGRPNNREKKFRELVAAAGDRYGCTVAETRTAYQRAYAPLVQQAQSERKNNDRALASGSIDAELHKTNEGAIKARFEAAMSELKPLADAYHAVSEPAEILYKADVLAATNELFPLATPNSETLPAVGAEATVGEFCAIGDPTCGGRFH